MYPIGLSINKPARIESVIKERPSGTALTKNTSRNT